MVFFPLFPFLPLSLSDLQLIPGVAAVPFYTTLIPLVAVLGVTLLKDGYDDLVSKQQQQQQHNNNNYNNNNSYCAR